MSGVAQVCGEYIAQCLASSAWQLREAALLQMTWQCESRDDPPPVVSMRALCNAVAGAVAGDRIAQVVVAACKCVAKATSVRCQVAKVIMKPWIHTVVRRPSPSPSMLQSWQGLSSQPLGASWTTWQITEPRSAKQQSKRCFPLLLVKASGPRVRWLLRGDPVAEARVTILSPGSYCSAVHGACPTQAGVAAQDPANATESTSLARERPRSAR